jgi:hypothetical protein
MRTFIDVLHAEWLKTRRSFASWLIVVGALFTPAIVVGVRLLHRPQLPSLYAQPDFWARLWRDSWESMAIFFLPMAAMLATSLITQIEYRNNAWKQVHALPLSPTTLYGAKLLVLLAMMLQFLLLFDIGIGLSALIPYWLTSDVPYPGLPPLQPFLGQSLLYFVDCLPIVAAQYLLSLRFKNFLLPIGFGFLAWVAALAATSSQYGYVIPYAYSMLDYLKDAATRRPALPALDFHWHAVAYFVALTLIGHWLFVHQRHKG